jgi:hypothetical protein
MYSQPNQWLSWFCCNEECPKVVSGLHDISSTAMMDVLSYNAGASSSNPAVPEYRFLKEDSVSLECCTIPSRAVSPRLASPRPRGQLRSPSLVSVGRRRPKACQRRGAVQPIIGRETYRSPIHSVIWALSLGNTESRLQSRFHYHVPTQT